MAETSDQLADIVLSCPDLTSAIGYYTGELGFQLDSIYPADAPRVATVSGFGIRVRLDSGEALSQAQHGLPSNKPSLIVTKFDQAGFSTGRAGMQYRDLIPDRYGGRFIASHIRIPGGGPVPDYVHYHDIRFQLIYCVKGWVRVVYEDQGPPMLLEPGDCFLQPPFIRHRVLECSDQLEVVEVSCPAEHETRVEHEMTLPTPDRKPDRDFGGQRFVFHKARDANWLPWTAGSLEYRDTGIAAATDGVASAVAVRQSGETRIADLQHEAEIRFLFVNNGDAELHRDYSDSLILTTGSAVAIPPDLSCRLEQISSGFEMLEVMAPAKS